PTETRNGGIGHRGDPDAEHLTADLAGPSEGVPGRTEQEMRVPPDRGGGMERGLQVRHCKCRRMPRGATPKRAAEGDPTTGRASRHGWPNFVGTARASGARPIKFNGQTAG